MKRLLCGILVAVAAVVASALTHAAVRQHTGELAQRVARTALEKSVSVRLEDRRSKCMSVIGSTPFCNCLNADLPLDVSFQKYITVTIAVGTPAHYDQLSADDKKIAPRIVSARDRCVAEVFASPSQ
jgi:hypothetical protein